MSICETWGLTEWKYFPDMQRIQDLFIFLYEYNSTA